MKFEALQSIFAGAAADLPEGNFCGRKKWGRGSCETQNQHWVAACFSRAAAFISTDYRSEGYKQAAKKDAATTNSSGGKSKPEKRRNQIRSG